jgi:uncharacterized protein (DUF2062 family)
VFRRRHPIPFWQRLRQSLWPERGWRRAGNYLLMRIKRLPGTPHSIAAGFAAGVFISFTPFIGFHLIGAFLISLLIRGNYIAAAVGTLVGNVWTFPFIWLLIYELGVAMLGPEAAVRTPADVDAWTLGWMTSNVGRLIWPMTVGGVPAGLVAGIASYAPMYVLIGGFQEGRRRRREHQRKRRAKLGIETTDPSTGAA